MSARIGIRLEDKSRWERRVPLTPEHMAELIRDEQLSFIVQPSPIRTYADEEYVARGAELNEDLGEAGVILAVKEVPMGLLLPARAYVFFAHVIKGQDYNMPLLRELWSARSPWWTTSASWTTRAAAWSSSAARPGRPA